MNRIVFYLAAAGLHAAVLFGVKFPISTSAAKPSPDKQYIEVTLVEPPLPPPPKPTPPPPPELPASPPPPPPPPPPLEQPPPTPQKPEPPPEPMPALMPERVPEPPPPPVVQTPAPSTPPSPIVASVEKTTTPPEPARPSAPANPYVEITQPSYASHVEPEYPSLARRLHQQGTVTLELYINILGSLDKVKIVKSSGYPMLDEAAVAAMKESHFHPAYQGTTPVPSRAQVAITFRLE